MFLFRLLSRLILVGFLLASPLRARGLDLGAHYPATLDSSEKIEGLEWSCVAGDVWRLAEFNYALGDQFKVELGPAQVVFGVHDRNVVWAAIFPAQPGKILSAPQGAGEPVKSVWLRFHPACLTALFPPASVSGPGDASQVVWARRLANLKMNACWQAGNLPVIPWKRSLTLDIETGGKRRFYSIDTDKQTVSYEDAFSRRTLPEPTPVETAEALKSFDTVWQSFDREYAMFAIKPGVDWAALRDQFRPQAAAAKTHYELGLVLASMLARLEDLHVYVMVGAEYIPGFNRPRPLNANWPAARKLVGRLTETPQGLAWGRTAGGLGYVCVFNLSNEELGPAFDRVLEQLADTRGLILDLRYNGGGSEPLGMQIAGRFIDQPRVYSLDQFRSGPRHADLGPKLERKIAPRDSSRYAAPVIVLQGQKTMSSAESFALMLAQCPNVTTMGDRTAGSSGNPRRLQLPGEITVNLPRWLDMDPSGKPIDGVGVEPRIKIKSTPSDFSGTQDPVLQAALQKLARESPAAPKP